MKTALKRKHLWQKSKYVGRIKRKLHNGHKNTLIKWNVGGMLKKLIVRRNLGWAVELFQKWGLL